MATKNTKSAEVTRGFCPVRQYTYDETKESEGIWFDLIDGARVKVARFGSPQFMEIYQKELLSLSTDVRNLTEDEQKKLDFALTCKTMAEVCLLDWENFVNLDGSELKYSKEAAIELLKLKDFYNVILGFAQSTSLFLKYSVEDAVKN